MPGGHSRAVSSGPGWRGRPGSEAQPHGRAGQGGPRGRHGALGRLGHSSAASAGEGMKPQMQRGGGTAALPGPGTAGQGGAGNRSRGAGEGAAPWPPGKEKRAPEAADGGARAVTGPSPPPGPGPGCALREAARRPLFSARPGSRSPRLLPPLPAPGQGLSKDWKQDKTFPDPCQVLEPDKSD